MIPYALLMITLKWNSSKNLEIRALDAVTDGFTFRTVKFRNRDFEEMPSEACCYFWDYRHRVYHDVNIRQFNIKKISDEETENLGAVLFEFTSQDEDFKNNLKKILRDYSDYIELKLNYDEISVMEELSGICPSDDFYENLSAYKKEQTKFLKKERCELPSVELAVCLDCPEMWNLFLELDFMDFLEKYWELNYLSGHFLTRKKITHIYVGNQFCPLLFPNCGLLKKIIEKIYRNNLVPVVATSTMSEHTIKNVKEILICLSVVVQNENVSKIEVVINDLGLPLLAKENNLNCFDYTLGILLNKRKKDFRKKDLNSRSSSVDVSFYRSYLMSRFNIGRVSYETCGEEIFIAGKNDILHMPLYQMNTSGFCTLNALCSYGDRGIQKSITECPHFCKNQAVLYSKNMNVVGIWNSLFSCSMKEINSPEILKSYIEKGIKRFVIRL